MKVLIKLLAQHKVAPDQPRVLYIKKLGVASRILSVGRTQDGALDAPKSAYDAGWFDGSAKPDENGAGTKFTYKVVFQETLPKGDVDMKKVQKPYGVAKGMNIITCTSTWIEDQKTLDKRHIVYAKQVE